MPHPTHLTQPQQFFVAGHPGDLPARRGHSLVGYRLHQRVKYRRAKVRPITDCEQGSLLVHCQ